MMSGKNEASPLLSIRVPLNKIRHYLSTFELTRGFFIALLGSAFIYLEYWNLSHPLPATLLGLLSLYLLLDSADPKIWFFYGFFTALFWFWWIGLSFIHYRMPWMIPFVELAIGGVYGALFWLIAKTADTIQSRLSSPLSPLPSLIVKSVGLLTISYIHPFGFDWFKPELMFVGSCLGIQKWQFAFVLAAATVTLWKKHVIFLLLLLPAFTPASLYSVTAPETSIMLVTTSTPVEEKWNRQKQAQQFKELFRKIETAIGKHKTLVVLPESVFPVFLNHEQKLMDTLLHYAQRINIVTGALFLDGNTPRNTTYIFTKNGKVTVANKVVLVPFGEANPLPDFLSDWVNRLFYDGAVDYQASSHVADYSVAGVLYRNAICFEATSETLYEGTPEKMIVLSNNGWFTPSTEPVLQALLLRYYSQKYGTTIFHAVNMAPSYIVKNGKLFTP